MQSKKLTKAALLLCFVIGVILIFAVPVRAATIKDGFYTLAGFKIDHDRVSKRYTMTIKNNKLTIAGPLFGDRKYKKKKRVLKIQKGCEFGYEYTSADGKSHMKEKCSYKEIVKISKKWMNRKGDTLTGEINAMDFVVKNGKVVRIYLVWTPYD